MDEVGFVEESIDCNNARTEPLLIQNVLIGDDESAVIKPGVQN